MFRVAGLAFAVCLTAALCAAPAGAADYRPASGVKVTVDACRAPRIEVARYQEQVCQLGAGGGYAACRWVDREHAVSTAGVCEPVDTVERSRPTERGAFPAHSRTPGRG